MPYTYIWYTQGLRKLDSHLGVLILIYDYTLFSKEIKFTTWITNLTKKTTSKQVSIQGKKISVYGQTISSMAYIIYNYHRQPSIRNIFGLIGE